MEDKKRNILFSEEQIKARVKELGEEITKDYEGKEVYILPLLRGSFVFGADIFKALDLKAKVGFMTTSSYGHGETSTGTVTVVNDIPDNIEEIRIIEVKNYYVINHVKKLGAKSVKTCVLLDKPSRRKVDLKPDYCCFEIEDLFVVGYGLDYEGYYRNVPYVFNWESK